MAFVKDIRIADNATPASATSHIVAKRLGKSLRERYQDFIHKRECDPCQQDYSVKMASRAIAAFSIYNLAVVDDVMAGQSVCDSSEDGGIDALCVNHNEKRVVVVQSKFNQEGNSTWTKESFLSFKDSCDKLQLGEYSRFDRILQRVASDIEIGLESQDYKFLFVMTHTGKRGAAEVILSDMQKWQDELNLAALASEKTPQEDLPFQVHLVSAEDLTEWLQAGTRVNIDLHDVEIENYGQIDEPYLAFYGQISGEQILEWWEGHGTRLFAKNIRNLLGSTDVNESIRNTAINNPEMFWYYNNGITLLVSDILPNRRNVSRDKTRGTFNFSNVSVINGAQTVSTIGQVFTTISEDNRNNLAQIKIFARFIKVDNIANVEVAVAITKANNHQNRVLGRDFASQHPEQLRISKELAVENYQYQLLRIDEKYSCADASTIDLDEALDGLACLTMSASIIATLKDKRGRFFENLDGTLYKTVFNPTVSGIKVINAVVHLRVIEQLIESNLSRTDRSTSRKRYLIITHANRVITALLLNKVSKIATSTELTSPSKELLSTKLELIINAAEQYIEINYTNAYPARFFVNVEKVNEILSVLSNSL
jgi:hypothetical protein